MPKKLRSHVVVPCACHVSKPSTSRDVPKENTPKSGFKRVKKRNMSADVHDKLAFKEEPSLFRYCEGNLSFSSSNDDEYNYSRKKMSRDPMSHRIIEKRRRDRMNNCLADLSRLIPPEYLKKGRGRIEKTEIIEMAIKHMRHLQNMIATSRYSENSDNSVPSPPEASRDPSAVINDQPIIVEHFRLGYLECLSEAMHYLVDVQGYFAGDSLCVQMINHLHKHCDKILKGNTLTFPKKHVGEASNASARPLNHSPVSSSTGLPSDDNLSGQNYESSSATSGKHLDDRIRSMQSSFRSPKRYSDGNYHPKRNSDGYQKSDGGEIESRSDLELQQSFALKCRTQENIKEEPAKSFLPTYDSSGNFGSRTYVPGGTLSADDSSHDTSMKDESPSQLREMLTSPSLVPAQANVQSGKITTDSKESVSPTTSTSGSPPHGGCHKSCQIPKNLTFKSHSVAAIETHEGNPDVEGLTSDNHHMMYKFKNNIKQRFSKENREIAENDSNGELPPKRLKLEEPSKYSEAMDVDLKRLRYSSESDAFDGSIANRLSFGHKSSDKLKRWEEPAPSAQYQNNPKLWALTPHQSTLPFSSQLSICGKPTGRPNSESSPLNNSFNNVAIMAPETSPGVPIFALHAKGSFYIPLTLDHAALAPFLTLLGIAKTDEEMEQNTILHPVTISVNFQSQLSQSPPRSLNG